MGARLPLVVGAELLWARNWNLAAAGACFTASSVANRVAVSTPLRIESLTSVVVMLLRLLCVGQAVASRCLPGIGRAASAAACLSTAALSCFCSPTKVGTAGKSARAQVISKISRSAWSRWRW